MSPFWFFTKKLLRKRATVAWAMVFALITAGGLGAGLLSLGPMLELILREGSSLAQLAEQALGWVDGHPQQCRLQFLQWVDAG